MSEPVGKRESDGGRRMAQPPGMPGWVKVSGLVVLVVGALLVAIMLLSGGDHGPGLHTGAGDPTRTPLVVGGADAS